MPENTSKQKTASVIPKETVMKLHQIRIGVANVGIFLLSIFATYALLELLYPVFKLIIGYEMIAAIITFIISTFIVYVLASIASVDEAIMHHPFIFMLTIALAITVLYVYAPYIFTPNAANALSQNVTLLRQVVVAIK